MIQEHISRIINQSVSVVLQEQGIADDASDLQVEMERPKIEDHGDFSTNFSLKYAKRLGLKPRELAEKIAAKISEIDPEIDTSVAGPGFINLKMPLQFWQTQVADIVSEGKKYGRLDIGGSQKVNVEYLSANPTGPLHIGHVRGAIIGQVIANILDYAGYDVRREYYVNDAGAQVDKLGRSAYVRYREALGQDVEEIPSGLYPGEYLIPIGEELADKHGDTWLDKEENEWLPIFRDFAIQKIMESIKSDLELLDINFDRFFSEKSLVAEGKVHQVLELLKEKDLIYTGVLPKPQSEKAAEGWSPEPLELFRSSKFGDDTDRPLRKTDGSLTYFASDIAYHLNKHQRGFKRLIDVWGADHGGYMPRLSAAVSEATDGECEIEYKICQMVRLTQGGQEARMSKRAGTFVLLRDVFNEVGKDVLFFTIATKSSDTPFSFDIEEAKKQSMDNPVFYVQYAHARASSVLRKAPQSYVRRGTLLAADLSVLNHPLEMTLIKKMSAFPEVIQAASEKLAPHMLTEYLNDLASTFHALWTEGKKSPELRFINSEDKNATKAKLALVKAFQIVMANGLRCCNVEPQQEMSRSYDDEPGIQPT